MVTGNAATTHLGNGANFSGQTGGELDDLSIVLDFGLRTVRFGDMLQQVIAAHPSYRPSTKEEIRALEARVKTRFHCVSCCTPAYYVITLGNWNTSVAFEYPTYEDGPTDYYILKDKILETLVEDWIADCVKKGKPWAREKESLPLTPAAEVVALAT